VDMLAQPALNKNLMGKSLDSSVDINSLPIVLVGMILLTRDMNVTCQMFFIQIIILEKVVIPHNFK
jgi:hypothetical protein